MRLYARVETDRATKSAGGEFIRIVLSRAESKKHVQIGIIACHVEGDTGDTVVVYRPIVGRIIELERIRKAHL